MTAVETLRSRAVFAASRGSKEYARYLNWVADKGEVAAQAELIETRELGRKIVEAALSPSATNVDSDGER